MFAESGKMHKPWLANGEAFRMGEVVSIVDLDTVTLEVGVCFSFAYFDSVPCLGGYAKTD